LSHLGWSLFRAALILGGHEVFEDGHLTDHDLEGVREVLSNQAGSEYQKSRNASQRLSSARYATDLRHECLCSLRKGLGGRRGGFLLPGLGRLGGFAQRRCFSCGFFGT